MFFLENFSSANVSIVTLREDIIPLYSDHEEADSRMFVHCEYVANHSTDINNSSKRIIVWYHFSQLSFQEFWFRAGTGRNRRFIPVHEADEKVGPDVCNLLRAMHALTGCDSTSNLNGIGKKGGFTTLKKHKDDLVGLKNLGTDCTVISDETLTVCFKFIGLLYGEVTFNLNHPRYKLFTKKHLESSKLPPTKDSALYMPKEPTINASFGTMFETGGFH